MALLAAIVGACGASPAGQVVTAPDRDIRAPIGPGQFYSRDRSRLQAGLRLMLEDAVAVRPDPPLAIVAPHAGYIYSGQIAADAYKQVAGRAYETVVILGTNHTSPPFRQVAMYAGAGFRTPLGVALVDGDLRSALMTADSRFVLNSAVHEKEHSVEVQVPFIQHLLPKARILPVVVGSTDVDFCVEVGRRLGATVKGRAVLIVASSDLSHYPAESDAIDADRRTLEAAVSMDPREFDRVVRQQESRGIASLVTAACGTGPILVAMAAAKEMGATHGVVLSYANSAEAVTGDRSRVVGYGALSYAGGAGAPDTSALARQEVAPPGVALDAADKEALLALARKSIERLLTTDTVPLARGFGPRASRLQGAFVTLEKDGELRGCIGHISPDAPLARQVAAMAIQAAFNDPRFDQLRLSELREIKIEISALTPPVAVKGPDEIVLGRDGVILRKGDKAAVFLPQVAGEQGWNREQMLDNLAVKAGLPPDGWRRGATFEVFQAEVFAEKES